MGPCFYHDITVDIPVEYQKTVQIMYYLWMCEWLLVDPPPPPPRPSRAPVEQLQTSCLYVGSADF